jgi:transcriptional regulator with XRE-family HTH domain
MTVEELRAALEELAWTQQEAAVRLGVRSGPARISEWVRGARPIPLYIAASVRAHLELKRCRDALG